MQPIASMRQGDTPIQPILDDGATEAAAPGQASHDGPAPVLARQVERHRPWYQRERRAAAAVVACSVITIGASAALVQRTFSGEPQVVVARAAPSGAADAVDDEAPADPLPVFVDEAPTALLAADDPVGEPVSRVPPPERAPSLRGVAASADQYGVIAAWTDRAVWVSRDDGRRFVQELAAPQPLTAVAVGADGRVPAARRGGHLGELTPAGATRWHDLGFAQILAIDAASPWIAVLGLHDDAARGLAPILSIAERGASWRQLVVPHHGSVANQVRVSQGGVVDLLTLDPDDETATADDRGAVAGRMRHYRGHVDGRPFRLVATGDGSGPFGLGHDGQSWHLEGGRAMHLAGTARLRATRLPLRGWNVLLAASGARTYALADGQVSALGKTAPRRVTRALPGHLDALAVDGLGRALATAGDAVLRHSARRGWRRLFTLPAR